MNTAVAARHPMPLEGRRIAVSVPSGFQLRQFVFSGIVQMLHGCGAEIVIVSPNSSGEGFTSALARPGISFKPLDPQMGRVRRRYFLARQHLLQRYGSAETLHQKFSELRRTHPETAWAARAGRRLMEWSPRFRTWALASEHLMFRDSAIEQVFESGRMDLVVLGSPGFTPHDAFLLHAARRRGVPVAAAVLSWDNLSAKGLINPQPDLLMVWSAHMRNEAVALQQFDVARVVETGSPVHDVFGKAALLGSRQDHFAKLGLDTSRKLIFYGTNHAGFLPDEIDVVKQVAEWVEHDHLGEPAQLWVRLHPQAASGPWAVNTAEYLALQSSRVRIEVPELPKTSMPWEFPKHDLEHLVKLLRDADVVINSGSLSIDAAVLDRPVVCIGFDTKDLPYEKSARRFYKFTHLAHIVAAGGVRVAESAEALQENIALYLKNPQRDAEGRRRIVEQQFGRVDGHSAERIVDAIVGMLTARSCAGGPQQEGLVP